MATCTRRGRRSALRVQESGHWRVLLDIPRWRWWWERAYTFAAPIPIKAGQMVALAASMITDQERNGLPLRTHREWMDERNFRWKTLRTW